PIYFAILRSRSSAIIDPQHAARHVDRGRDYAHARVRSGRLLPRASSGSQLGTARALRGGVERRAGPEPRDLLVRHAVVRPDRLGGPVGLADDNGDRLPGRQAPESGDAHAVILPEPFVVARIAERQRQDALLLEVRLVDAREAPDDHRLAAEIARAHRGVLPARPFAVVLVA